MGRFSLRKVEYVLSKESAESAVMDLVEYYRVDVDELDKSHRSTVEDALGKLVSFYRQGLLENVRESDGTISVKQHLNNPPGEVKEIIYRHIQGRQNIALDSMDTQAIYGRVYQILASMSGISPDGIIALQDIDLRVANNLGYFFMIGVNG